MKDITLRLGFDLDNSSLTLDEVNTMWTMCRLEFSWNMKRKSPWCAVNTIFVSFLKF